MNKYSIITILCIFTISFGAKAQGITYLPSTTSSSSYYDYPTFSSPRPRSSIPSRMLKDGYYEATVLYSSYTGHQATYDLVVKVVDDRVVSIYFDDDEYIHTGKNNSGYHYRGGSLSPVYNNRGDIIALSGMVETYQNPPVTGSIQYLQTDYRLSRYQIILQ